MALLHLLIYGSLAQIGICIGVYFMTGCVGMSVTFHRYLAHKSWSAPRWFEILGTFCGTVGLTGSSLSWSAIHRQHHHYTDTPKDPHSPLFKGFFRSHFFSMFEEPRLSYVRTLVKDRLHRHLHRYYLEVNLAWAVFLWLLDPYAVIYAYLAPAAILWNGGSSINSFCHMWGYQNFKSKDSSRNNFVFGFLTWGEGWHNNHHRYPRRSSFQIRPWEFDMGGFLIKRLASSRPGKNPP